MTDLAGGVMPLLRVARNVHTFDGVTYVLDVTWLRRVVRIEYHSPRLPRDVRRVRARELDRLRAINARPSRRGPGGRS